MHVFEFVTSSTVLCLPGFAEEVRCAIATHAWFSWDSIRRSYRLFLDGLFGVAHSEPNPLSILMRAINALHLPMCIKQPRWSALRWRSTT